MEENKLSRKGPGDIIVLNWPECVLVNPEYMLGSLSPDPSGKPCEGACNAFREIIDNAIDTVYDNPDANLIIVDTENYNGYNLIADNSYGIKIDMSEVPGKTMANLSISALNSGSKFNGYLGSDSGAHIGRHGVGSACVAAISKEYILLSKITQENYDKSIPAVKELWESQGPRSKKDLFYIIVYQNYGHLAYEGAMKLQDINKKLGVQLPQGMSTIVLFKLGEQYVPDPRVVIPYDNLNYFLLILKEFYKRKVNVIANGKTMTAADLSNNYKFKIIKTIIPEDQSKNKEVKVLIYFDVDPEMPSKTFCGSVNGLVVNTGLHQTYVENSYEQAIRAEYKITHRYTMNGLRMCVVMLAESIGFDSQTKIRLKSIAKVKQSDFTGTLVKEFVKIFRANPEYWEEHIGRLNTIYNSMKSFTAAEKAQKMIEDAQGRNMFKAKAELIPGFSDATGTDRWNCELFLCFTGDTEILTCNNEKISFVDLINRLENGEEIYTFSCTSDGIIKPAKIIAAKKIKQSSKIANIILDNGEKIRCTPDHEIMMLDGNYKRASDLIPGESLMPIYIKEVKDVSTNEDYKNNSVFNRRVVSSKKMTGEIYGRPYKISDDERYDYYVYRIMATHPDSIKHKSLNNLSVGESKVRHHIDNNPLNDYPTNLMWCGSRWHRAHHGANALHKKAEQDSDLYNKVYVDSKRTPEYSELRRQISIKYYNTEDGKRMKENLKDKAIKEWSSEKLRDWRSKETKKYSSDHPEWVKENIEKKDRIIAENIFNEVNKFIEENNLRKTSFEFNKVILLWKISSKIKNNYKYFDFIKEKRPDLIKDYEISDINDPMEISAKLILEKLKNSKKNITISNFNDIAKDFFKVNKLNNGKGYLALKKKFPKLFEQYEYDLNKNHKVLSVIVEDCVEDVYCLEVDTPEHNFPLASGVFVKNCEGLSPAGSLKSGRHDTLHHSVLPLRGKILSVEGKSIDQALDNKEIFTIFKVIGLGMDVNNVTSKASSYEEGYELIKKYSRFGKIVIAVD